jgi:signal transduction histidine kinase
VIDNLLENAIEYSPPETVIEVEARLDQGEALIAVTDQGPGLPAGEEERVFERFFRGSAAGTRAGGSGLGLAIVRGLAERWGGSARISNRPSRGARAEVRLPGVAVERSLPRPDRELDEALPRSA